MTSFFSKQRHNKMLESVTLRYLYRSGERNKVLPQGDVASADIKVTHETGQSNSIQVGVQPHPNLAPTINVHAQRDSKLTYERPMRSWRKGLSYEMCTLLFK